MEKRRRRCILILIAAWTMRRLLVISMLFLVLFKGPFTQHSLMIYVMSLAVLLSVLISFWLWNFQIINAMALYLSRRICGLWLYCLGNWMSLSSIKMEQFTFALMFSSFQWFSFCFYNKQCFAWAVGWWLEVPSQLFLCLHTFT